MRLFRKKARPEAETIAEFWQWWATARDDVAVAIPAGAAPDYADELSRRVTPHSNRSATSLSNLRPVLGRVVRVGYVPDAMWTARM